MPASATSEHMLHSDTPKSHGRVAPAGDGFLVTGRRYGPVLAFSACAAIPTDMGLNSSLVLGEATGACRGRSVVPDLLSRGSTPGLIGHYRGCMTSMVRLFADREPGWRRTTLFTSADLCSILEVNFPGPLRGGSPSSTESLAVVASRSGSDQ